MAGNPIIRFNPTHAPTTMPKMAEGMKMPGSMVMKGLGGKHFANAEYIQEGHNTKKMGAHPGFKALVKSGVPAGALANTSRHASAAAKRKNPRLNRVKG